MGTEGEDGARATARLSSVPCAVPGEIPQEPSPLLCINTGKHPVGAVEVCQSLGLVKYPHRPTRLSSQFWMTMEPLGVRDLLRKWTTAGEPWSFMLGPTSIKLSRKRSAASSSHPVLPTVLAAWFSINEVQARLLWEEGLPAGKTPPPGCSVGNSDCEEFSCSVIDVGAPSRF